MMNNVIDIRTQKPVDIRAIQFGDEAHAHSRIDRDDTAHFINIGEGHHPESIFIETSKEEYIAVRRSDVSNLIAALEKAKQIWGCE